MAPPISAPGYEQDPAQPRKKRLPDAPAYPGPTAPAAPPVQPAAQQQPSPTNFVNFSRRFSANQDVSQREAAKYSQQATDAEGKAASALGAAQQKFQQGVNTGTVQAPGGAPSTNTGGAVPPAQPAPAPIAPPAFGSATQAPAVPVGRPQPASAAPATGATPPPPQPGTSSQALSGESTKGVGEQSIADMLAKAGSTYTGPEGLDTTGATAPAQAAQQQLDLLKDANGVQTLVNESGPSGTVGADKLSGALIGQAGRQGFDALRAKFNPNKELSDAQDAAVKTAADAKATSATNAAAWGSAASQAQAAKNEQDADTAANDARTKTERDAAQKDRLSTVPTSGDPNNLMAGLTDPADIAERNKEIAAWGNAQKSTTNDSINNAFEDFNSVMSPVNWVTNAAGVRDPVQDYETGNAHGGSGADSGGAHGRNIDWASAGPKGFWVYRQMTPDDWKTLNSKPRNGPNGQLAWIQTKYDRLLQDQKTKNASAASQPAVGTSRSG